MLFRVLMALALAAFLVGCSDDSQPKQPPKPSAARPAAGAAATPPDSAPAAEVGKEITTPSGLKYTITKAGTGKVVKKGDTVTVHYTGTLTDGTKFDSSYDHGGPIDFPIGVGRVIAGWDEGIVGMREGEKRTLVIPGNLAYGSNPPPGSPIPPNATLKFDVELIKVQ